VLPTRNLTNEQIFSETGTDVRCTACGLDHFMMDGFALIMEEGTGVIYGDPYGVG
jgi:hypothetical protein